MMQLESGQDFDLSLNLNLFVCPAWGVHWGVLFPV